MDGTIAYIVQCTSTYIESIFYLYKWFEHEQNLKMF